MLSFLRGRKKKYYPDSHILPIFSILFSHIESS